MEEYLPQINHFTVFFTRFSSVSGTEEVLRSEVRNHQQTAEERHREAWAATTTRAESYGKKSEDRTGWCFIGFFGFFSAQNPSSTRFLFRNAISRIILPETPRQNLVDRTYFIDCRNWQLVRNANRFISTSQLRLKFASNHLMLHLLKIFRSQWYHIAPNGSNRGLLILN